MNAKFRELANKVIRRVLTVLGFSSTLAFMACYGPAMGDCTLEVDPDTIQFDADGEQKQEVMVRARQEWKVVEHAEFVKLTSLDGRGDVNVQVEAEPNEKKRAREGIIVFEAEDTVDSTGVVRDTVFVVQKPA